MITFFKNLLTVESTFRAAAGTAGAIMVSNPEIFGSWGWVPLVGALLITAGDKNPE